MKIKVGVIFGGCTVEHEVSIISAVQAINNIDEEKYDVVPIYISKDRIWYTGALLKDIEIYKDLDLLKRYATQVTLCKKNNEFYLIKRSRTNRYCISNSTWKQCRRWYFTRILRYSWNSICWK